MIGKSWRDDPQALLEFRLKRLWAHGKIEVPADLGGGIIERRRDLLYILHDADGEHILYNGGNRTFSWRNTQEACEAIMKVLSDVYDS